MRALASACLLAACATSTDTTSDFSWLEGCWRDSVTRVNWHRADGGNGWRADVEIETACTNARDAGNSCLYRIMRDQNVWTFTDEIGDNVQTYALVESRNGHAKFQTMGHPLRPRPEIFLTIALEDGRYSMIETGGVVPIVWMDAERC